jgi:hypothetical protein
MLVLLNCPTSKITIFYFYTKSLQRTRTPHILIYLLNIGIHIYYALALVCICIFSSSVNLFSDLLETRAYMRVYGLYVRFYAEHFEQND